MNQRGLEHGSAGPLAFADAVRASLESAGTRRHRGLFITFEGGDGTGKTTQIATLARVLEDSGLRVLSTREPGGTALGVELRRMVMHGPEDVDPRTEALLYAADRAYHIATVVRPALESGAVVLQDRFADSSVAYQGAARQLGADEVRGLSAWATGDLTPDVTVLLDLDPVVGMARVGRDQDRLERSGAQFHQRVRDAYLAMAEQFADRFCVVDAGAGVEEVAARVQAALAQALAGKATAGRSARKATS